MASLKLKFNTLRVFHPLLFFFFFVTVLSDDFSDDEREYMLRLMKAITPTPSNWSHKTDVCNWRGVTCDSGSIDHIDLSSMSLTGTFPSGLNDSLRSITRIDLSNNSLSGPVPSLANLLVLHNVILSDNNFTSIPDSCFQGLIGLQTLYLYNNVNLKPWKFPTHLTDSSALAVLHLRATNLMGSLPNIFHSFPNLLHLYLSNNRLSGVLPESFAHSKIKILVVNNQNSDDKLSGTIKVLSYMTDLQVVRLQENNFKGPIPDLSNCTEIYHLELQGNLLTGIVPTSLMNLPQLERVYLGNNWLQGPLPVFNKSVVVSLDVNTSNAFCLNHTGPCDRIVNFLLDIVAEFGYPLLLARSWRGNNPCKGWRFITCDGDRNIIRIVNLTKLNLNGTISTAFGNLTGLQQLYLNGNNLQGSIPESLTTLHQLEFVDVSYNNLSGTIPRFSHKAKINTTGNSAFLQHSQENRTTLWIAGAACSGVIIILVVIIYYVHKRHLSIKKRTLIDNNFEDFMKKHGSMTLKRYRFSEIKRMTNSFSNKLGKGGYGTVYKASLSDGRQVAVKVLSESNGSGEEFINEVASISTTSHVNIVSLLGFCYEKSKRALIYEFMPNGSLDKFIYKKGSPNTICDLDWNTLFQITISIARGLEYLHRGCNTRILHLDIKPQNILLDEDFCPKIADFGLATICKKKESIVSIGGLRGTPGYIAPEVYSRSYGGVSHKSDVYSYGMLVLEVVGGRKNYDSEGSNTTEMCFPDWIYKDVEQGNIPTRHLVDTKEENDIIMKITLVSLWCIQTNPSERPSMSKVVEMLEGSLQLVSFPPKPILGCEQSSSIQFSNTSYSHSCEAETFKSVH